MCSYVTGQKKDQLVLKLLRACSDIFTMLSNFAESGAGINNATTLSIPVDRVTDVTVLMTHKSKLFYKAVLSHTHHTE